MKREVPRAHRAPEHIGPWRAKKCLVAFLSP